MRGTERNGAAEAGQSNVPAETAEESASVRGQRMKPRTHRYCSLVSAAIVDGIVPLRPEVVSRYL